jgi:VCBS repeat-containing protein
VTAGPRATRRSAIIRAGLVGAASLRLLIAGVAVPFPAGALPLTAEVESVNHPPVATDDKAALDAGATIEDPAPGLLFNDVDADGDPLVAIRRDPPEHGTVIVRRDGSWSYTPESTFAGTDSFTYLVSDGFMTSVPATVLITVRGPADAATPAPATAAPTAAPTSSPSPRPSPTAMPALAAPPSTGPGAEGAFSIPEQAASGAAAEDIGLEASSVAGLGPVLWIVPTVLLAVPGLALVLVAIGRAARRSGRLGGPRPGSAQAGAARS